MPNQHCSVDPLERFNDKVMFEPNSGCHLWMADCFNNGYGKFWYERKSRKAHRFSWLAHRGEIPHGLRVLHKCDTPSCVNPDHLFLGTDRDNARDRAMKDRSGIAKLRNSEIPKIRADPRICREIAADYGVSEVTISHIKTKRNWKHI